MRCAKRAHDVDMPLSRLVVERAHADNPDRHPLVLSETEQWAMRDALAEWAELVQALGRGLPGYGGINLLDTVDLLATEWRR